MINDKIFILVWSNPLRLEGIQLQLLGMRIYIFSEPTISRETYENDFKKHMVP